MLVTELEMIKEVKPLQELKAYVPMLVTELGMVKDPVKPLQPQKACSLMLVTELGIIKDPVRPLQP